MRDAERVVWHTLQQLDASWHVFYSVRENSGSGWDREIDFVLIRLNCIFYCEVKGGVVFVDQRAGPGVTWAHSTRSGKAIDKRVNPTQLWAAKDAVERTIRQTAGHSPRELGFQEHNFYIFPYTPRQVAQGADLERDNIHYAFEEDMAGLPARLQQIVASGRGRFIAPEHIESIINSLDAMVIKENAGTLPQPPQVAPAPTYGKRTFQPFRLRRVRLPRLWKIAGALIVLLAIVTAFMDFGFKDFTTPQPKQRNEPVRQTNQPAASPPRPPSPAPKPPGTNLNAALPAFIAPTSVDEVERAITAAQDATVYVSWQSGSEHGLVILRLDDTDGCRQYQISRHDEPPIKLATIRRCY